MEQLQEFSTDILYANFINVNHKKESINQRLAKIIKQFQNTKYYDIDPITKSRKKTGRTNLELASRKYCTKEEFEKEFLEYDFDDNKTAEIFLRSITDLFDEEGWLKL